jgi:hypothetical protein
MTDTVARDLSIAGLAIGLLSIALTLYLWRRSGPNLSISAFVSARTGRMHVTVTCNGRLATTLKRLVIADYFVSIVDGKTTIASRWTLEVAPNDRALPQDLAPTAHLEADVPVQSIFAKASDPGEVTVRALVQREGGKWAATRPLRIR